MEPRGVPWGVRQEDFPVRLWALILKSLSLAMLPGAVLALTGSVVSPSLTQEIGFCVLTNELLADVQCEAF